MDCLYNVSGNTKCEFTVNYFILLFDIFIFSIRFNYQYKLCHYAVDISSHLHYSVPVFVFCGTIQVFDIDIS